MSKLDQEICAWGSPLCAATSGVGLLMSGFVPPPSPTLSSEAIAAICAARTVMIRLGMIISLFGIAGYIAVVSVITTRCAMRTASRLPADLQLGAIPAGILADRRPDPIFPHWAAYLNTGWHCC